MRDERLAARVRESAEEAPNGSSIVPLGQSEPSLRGLAPRWPAATQEAFDRAAEKLEARIDRLAETGLGAMRASLPPWFSAADPGWALLEKRLRASLRAELLSFRRGALPGGLPAHDAFLVDVAGERGELDQLLGGYRFVLTSLCGAWFEVIGQSRLTSRVKRDLLDSGSRFFLRYADLVSRYIADAYRRRTERSGGSVRLAEAPSASTVDGNPFADARQAFDFDRYHLGVIVTGGGPHRTARGLAEAMDRVVEIREHGTSWWVCLSGHEQISEGGMRELEGFVPEPGLRMAIGLEGFGEEGLCASFRRALWAQSLAGPELAVAPYADVAVEALALWVEDDVRNFVGYELRGIDDNSAGSRRLRETLDAYFACDLNAASAAAKLGVHHQTVANRLRTIEGRLGHPLRARTLELALALRLRERIAA